jgi:hypothetical protein
VTVRVYRNPRSTGKRWGTAKLPVRQTLVWAGPLFITFRR